MSDSSPIGIVILAAGASRRLGRPKQLVPYKSKPLLQHTIDLAVKTEVKVALVLGAFHQEIKEKTVTEGVDIVLNRDWEEGVSSSVTCGLSYLLETATNLEHVMFLLSDQPFLSSEVLEKLISLQTSPNPSIAASTYDQQIGVPAIFSHHFFNDLLELKGDHGAKKVIMNNMKVVQTILFEKGELDVDTEEDLSSL